MYFKHSTCHTLGRKEGFARLTFPGMNYFQVEQIMKQRCLEYSKKTQNRNDVSWQVKQWGVGNLVEGCMGGDQRGAPGAWLVRRPRSRRWDGLCLGTASVRPVRGSGLWPWWASLALFSVITESWDISRAVLFVFALVQQHARSRAELCFLDLVSCANK